MSSDAPARFIKTWDYEARQTLRLLRALPANAHEFRPDPEGRSLGEVAWHLAEIEAVMTFGVELGKYEFGVLPPGFKRPETLEAIPAAYERVHADAVARVRKLSTEDFAREIEFLGGRKLTISTVLWAALLHHQIHHRGQLALLCRLAGGTPPSMYGPSREDSAALRARD